MAWSQDDLDAIEETIKTGTLEVKYKDRSVKYQSLSDLLRIRDLIRAEIGITSGRNKRILSEFDRGY